MARKTLTKRQEKARETKERIYSSAIELMDRKGFERITIADISRKAGVSVGAFYHYFKSKNEILAEIFRQADDFYITTVLPELADENIPQQIVKYFHYYAIFNQNTGVETVTQLHNPKIKFFIKKSRPMLTILQDLVQKGQDNREIRTDMEAAEIARFLFIVARGTVYEWCVCNGRYDLEAAMSKFMSAAVGALTRSSAP